VQQGEGILYQHCMVVAAGKAGLCPFLSASALGALPHVGAEPLVPALSFRRAQPPFGEESL
jgi:hypothetical protein